MLLKYIGPKPEKRLDPRWGKEYLFGPPSMTCEVAETDAKILLAECRGIFVVITPGDAAKTSDPPKPVEIDEATHAIPPKFENHFGGKRGRPRKNGT